MQGSLGAVALLSLLCLPVLLSLALESSWCVLLDPGHSVEGVARRCVPYAIAWYSMPVQRRCAVR